MKHLSTLLAAVALSASPLLAQSAATPPAGAISYTVLAGPNKLTAISVPLREAVPGTFVGASSGVIAGVVAGPTGQDTITVTGAGWDPLQFRDATKPYFVRIMSGAAVGRTLFVPTSQTTNTATTLNLEHQGASLVGVVAAGDKFEAFPGDTLKSFFKELVDLGTITTNASLALADAVQIHNGSNWITYYHNGTNWRQSSPNLDRDTFPLRPDAVLLFTRRSGAQFTFTALGTVPTTDLKVVIRDGGTVAIGNPFPVTRPLSSFGFQNFTSPNWVTAASAAVASTGDRIQIHNGTNWQTFYYTGSAWRVVSPNLAQDPSVPVGRPMVLIHPTSASTVTVRNFALPYTL